MRWQTMRRRTDISDQLCKAGYYWCLLSHHQHPATFDTVSHLATSPPNLTASQIFQVLPSRQQPIMPHHIDISDQPREDYWVL